MDNGTNLEQYKNYVKHLEDLLLKEFKEKEKFKKNTKQKLKK